MLVRSMLGYGLGGARQALYNRLRTSTIGNGEPSEDF